MVFLRTLCEPLRQYKAIRVFVDVFLSQRLRLSGGWKYEVILVALAVVITVWGLRGTPTN